ncbi:hypothetical protein CBR_g39156 [Chara braunii]|uniref:C2 domain-containing protein n=1 Tax=Chara braunii TaxID=69332 RepID=A0A388LR89_CHABU|nr:hypothetical protein CBR_g39156 [Chara braunii]|eukprot:GBG84779.1 hypothetical protein CBR_g39156 [Chara braunii]
MSLFNMWFLVDLCQSWWPFRTRPLGYRCRSFNALEAVQFMMKQSGEKIATVQISLSASSLLDMDVFSKSDPMVVVELCETNTDVLVWSEIGRTEIIWNDLNPKWAKNFTLSYRFHAVQLLRFSVYDVDTLPRRSSSSSSNGESTVRLEDQDFLGVTECSLAELVQAHGQVLTRELRAPPQSSAGSTSGRRERMSTKVQAPGKMGTLTIRVEEVPLERHETVTLQFHAQDLDKMDTSLFGNGIPYLKVSKIFENGTAAPVFETPLAVVGGQGRNLVWDWDPTVLSLQDLCNGDQERPLRIECFGNCLFSDDTLIGSTGRSVKQLAEDAQTSRAIPLTALRSPSPLCRRKRPDGSEVTGKLFCKQCRIMGSASFLQYVSMGCEISFHVAIDFTASNGHQSKMNSLHFIHPQGWENPYQRAIRTVGTVVEFYDMDKRFPAWGFGANVGRSGMFEVSHCFNLNGNPLDSEVVGVEGVLKAYSRAVHSVSLAGPTLFAPVISKSAEIAEEHLKTRELKYSVLLIITDGIINDIDSTIDTLIEASRLPLSILIVGVGSADFSSMEVLDSDNGLLQRCGRQAERDIVQFVAMKNITSDHHLARELLAELPGQVVQFMSGFLKIPVS